jgi:hypothetical protein
MTRGEARLRRLDTVATATAWLPATGESDKLQTHGRQ